MIMRSAVVNLWQDRIPALWPPVRAIVWVLARQKGRRDLARLDEHMLADIGLTRTQAVDEAEKPYWRA
jgi:uncharacterized protein YjiS (DUF1127 family)